MKTCGKGHVWDDSCYRQCQECQRITRKKRYREYKEHDYQKQKEWVANNRDRRDQSLRDWENDHPGNACYRAMVNRCTNDTHPNFKHYGGRGIAVCERWLGEGGCKNFIADIGERPSSKHTIDRINNDGNYEPGNVRWAVKKTQMRNFRRNVNVTIEGRTQCLAAWAEELNLTPASFWLRYNKGWPEEKLLRPNMQPDQKRKRELNTAMKKAMARPHPPAA